MTVRVGRRLLATVTVAAACVLAAACGDDEDRGGPTGSGGCVGEQTGEVTVVAGGDVALPGGGSVGIGSVFSDDDPPHISLIVASPDEQEQEAAQHLEVGDTFSVQGASYTVDGFCEDKAYLTPATG
jgi:hypothetical protein